MLELLRELIEGGFIGQAIIATIVTIIVAYLAITGKAVPEFLAASWGLIVGWFFRSQAQAVADRKAAREKKTGGRLM